MKHNSKIRYIAAFLASLLCMLPASAAAADDPEYSAYGGGYAATGQIPEAGFTTELYDASNSLPTSDAMFLLSADDGKIWIGGYSGVIAYDGSVFERLDTAEGLTSARGFFEDSKGRIWVGTNDNGVVVIDGETRVHLTYREGLPSSSIRIFAEDPAGNVFIGTTSGICYADPQLNLHEVPGADLTEERVLRLDTGADGTIYGQTSSGMLFSIEDCAITRLYESRALGMPRVTTLMADPEIPGNVWLGTEDAVYYGAFGDAAALMECIPTGALGGNVHWISYDCGRIWISSTSAVGYLDESRQLRVLDGLAVSSGIEMTTADYQGNLWVASSTQGVMKVVTNNFLDVTGTAGMHCGVADAVHIYGNELYIGTDHGLRILRDDGEEIKNALTARLGGTRVRCIAEDAQGTLWLGTYTNDVGLFCYSPETREYTSFTTENGMPDNQIRCVTAADDGSIFVGTNGGLAVIENGKVVRTVSAEDGINNTVFLNVAKMPDGTYLAGSDGDGLYVIGEDSVTRLGRDDGLTSEVIMRIIPDEERGVYWLVTSNSIEYLRDGTITQVTSFPYNNNYDIHFDDSGHAWILSSFGVYTVDADEMLHDHITDYSLYTVANGLPYAVTSNAQSTLDTNGDLYMPGRNGIIRVNIHNYFEKDEPVLTGIRSLTCDDVPILPDDNGAYHIPASRGRVQISASVLDYTMLNPTVRIWLEGGPDEGITVQRSDLSALEYTNLPYGNYTLHIQILEKNSEKVLQDDTYQITKAARFSELLIVRILLMLLLAAVTGYVVWRTMRSTVIARQYDEIRHAKEEAERANTAKSRFLANMSHEIRTPINTIMGTNEMVMREDATGVPQGYFLSMMNYAFDIRSASESLLGLINDLLDISKIESGRMHLVEQEYDVRDMLRSVISMIRVRCKEKGLTFDVAVEEILPCRFYGDDGKIKQIILNFLTNAVKYTSIGGMILSVSMEARDGDTATLRFSVKDTGMGIRQEDLDKLFTAYERLDEELNSSIQGTGLGLDISRRFAELMGGELRCESVYREGSEFILTLPQRIVDDTPVGVFSEQAERTMTGPYIPQFIAPDADILIVDDDPTNLSLMKGLLKATRAFITTSGSGEDAIDKIRDSHFDVVFLDIIMPGMDGLAAIAKIREFNTELPVYAITANATESEDFYLARGFNGFLAKPIDGEDLERTIMRHIPDAMMEIPERTGTDPQSDLPGDMQWLREISGLNVPEGIKNAGGVQNYLFSLRLFRDTIDGNIATIREAWDSSNIRLYTIKVHALSISARIIGASALSALASQLEEAGSRQDMGFVRANAERLLTDYAAFREPLSRLGQDETK